MKPSEELTNMLNIYYTDMMQQKQEETCPLNLSKLRSKMKAVETITGISEGVINGVFEELSNQMRGENGGL